MEVGKWNEVEARAATEPGAKGVTLRVLMGKDVGAPNFVMRRFELAPGGNTPFHSHPWEHEVYVLSGKGTVLRKDGEEPIVEGSFVYVAPGEEHGFSCAGREPLAFLCVVPAGKYPGQ